MIDSATIVSETPAYPSQSHNVRKCPVLSGPTDLPEETHASPDTLTTCAQNASHPDRTPVRSSPLPTSRPPSQSPSPSPQRMPQFSRRAVATDSSCCFVTSCLCGEKGKPESDPPNPRPSPTERQCPVAAGAEKGTRSAGLAR